MSGLSKRLPGFPLLLCAVIVLCGCQNTISVPPNVIETKPIVFKSPIEIPYLVANPLEVIEAQVEADGSYERTVLISGLQDKAVEDKINERLKSLYDSIKTRDLPPYRGILVRIPKGSELVRSSLHTHVEFNHNNVLSVVVTNYRNYAVPNSSGQVPKYLDDRYLPTEHVSLIDTLNIDLTSGDDVSLHDVFTDDSDWLTVINNLVSQTLMKDSAFEESGRGTYWGGSGLRLVSAFKGIPLDQIYYLNRQGGLTLVFNHQNPEFDLLYGPASLTFDFKDFGPNIALAQRYQNEGVRIFESNAPISKGLLVTDHSNKHITVAEERILGEGRVSVSYSYMEWLPAEMVSFINQLAKDAWVRAEEMQSNIWELTYSASVNVAGSFINITAWQNGYLRSGWGNLAEYYCFNKDFKPVLLADLFVKGFDYRSIIVGRLNKVLADNESLGQYSVEEFYNGLQFYLTQKGVQFCTAPTAISNQGIHSLIFDISYEDFGCENMTIFN